MTKQNSVYVVYEIDWKTFQFFSKQGGLVFYRSPFLIQVLGKKVPKNVSLITIKITLF